MSLTKVDFKALDKFQVKPIGIYGSKEEIVRFLVSIAVIDDTMYVTLYFVMRYLLLTSWQLRQVTHLPGNKKWETGSPLWAIHLPRFPVHRRSGKNVCNILARRVDMGRWGFSTCAPESCNLHEASSSWDIIYRIESLTFRSSDISRQSVIKSQP